MEHCVESVEVYPLLKSLHHMPTLIVHANATWKNRGGKADIQSILTKKTDLIKAGVCEGVMLFYEEEPLGFAIVTYLTPHHGNMILHVVDQTHSPFLVKAVIKSLVRKDTILELIHFWDTDHFRQSLIKFGGHQVIRQRMAFPFEKRFPLSACPEEIQLEPLTQAYIQESARLSYVAHHVAQDFRGYKDLESIENRLELEDSLFNGVYGAFIPDASLVCIKEGTPIGVCSVVDVPIWGVKHVPWIFDVVIDPEYQSKGYGRFLLEHVLGILSHQRYPLVGLGVSLENEVAIRLYERMGFRHMERFYEFLF